jgi:hypothetical protein
MLKQRNKQRNINKHTRAHRYGPFWISSTLIFTLAVSGTVSTYFSSEEQTTADVDVAKLRFMLFCCIMLSVLFMFVYFLCVYFLCVFCIVFYYFLISVFVCLCLCFNVSFLFTLCLFRSFSLVLPPLQFMVIYFFSLLLCIGF